MFGLIASAMIVIPVAAQSPGKTMGRGNESRNDGGGLRVSWSVPDHPSALFHVKSSADVTIFMDNTSGVAVVPGGEILFGKLEPVASQSQAHFNPLSVTPMVPAPLASGQRARIAIPVAFAGAGAYQFRWKHDNMETPIACGSEESLAPAATLTLQCIFAPRTTQDSPWLAPLPPAAVWTPGYLADFIRQTTVRRFLIDERFAFDSASGIGLGFGASLSGPGLAAESSTGLRRGLSAVQIDAFLTEAARAKASLVLRLSVPLTAPDPRTLAAFKKYVSDALGRSHSALNALAITPESPAPAEPSASQRGAFQTYYLAAYAAAKRADKNIAMLGAGSAKMTGLLLGDDLRSYLDALAASDAAGDAVSAQAFLARGAPGKPRLPLWILPPRGEFAAPIPPAAALATGATVVPIPAPEADHGVTAHLLNGTVFIQRIHLATLSPDAPSPLPFIALFQGDGYSLAAIAGPSAGTELDAALPGLARGRTQVEPGRGADGSDGAKDQRPRYPNIEVSDDTRAMRVVDAQGDPVECRYGDSLFAPAEDKVVYLLQAGRADDLAGSLRPSRPNRLPMFEISVRIDPDAPKFSVDLENIALSELSGSVRVLLPARDNAAGLSLGDKELPALAPGKHVALSFEMPSGQLTQVESGPVVVEITTGGTARPVIQRTALVLAPSVPQSH